MDAMIDAAFKATEAVLWRIDEAVAALSAFDTGFLNRLGIVEDAEARCRDIRAALLSLNQALTLLETVHWPDRSDYDRL